MRVNKKFYHIVNRFFYSESVVFTPPQLEAWLHAWAFQNMGIPEKYRLKRHLIFTGPCHPGTAEFMNAEAASSALMLEPWAYMQYANLQRLTLITGMQIVPYSGRFR